MHPLYGTIFGFFLSERLKIVYGNLEAQGLTSELPWSGRREWWSSRPDPDAPPPPTVSLRDVGYADDEEFLVLDGGEPLLTRMSLAAAVVVDPLAAGNLKTNFSPGKSEGVVTFGGYGVKAFKDMLSRQGQPSIPVPSTLARPSNLLLARTYPHVGGCAILTMLALGRRWRLARAPCSESSLP